MYEFMLVFGVVLWLAVLVIYVRSPIASTFHPISFMLFFQGLLFAARPILAYVKDFDVVYRAYEFRPTWEAKTLALGVTDVGFVVFCLTAARFGNKPMIIRTPKMEKIADQWRPSFLLCGLLCLPIGALSMRAVLESRFAGTTTMVRDVATGFAVNTTGNGYLVQANLLLSTLVVVLAWLFRFRLMAIIPFLFYALVRASTGGRWPFVMATGALLLLYLFETRRRWLDVRTLAAGLAVMMLFSAVGADRGAGIRSLVTGEAPPEAAFNAPRFMEGLDWGSQEFTEYFVTIVPYKTGTYDYFLSNLILFTAPIPRAMWPSKPIGSPIQLFSIFDYGNPIGITYTMAGMGWVEFGWLGVILWCGLFGALAGKVYNWFVACRQTPMQVAGYCMFAPMTLIFFRDGSLPELVNLTGFLLIPIFIWWGLKRLRIGERRTLGPPALTSRPGGPPIEP